MMMSVLDRMNLYVYASEETRHTTIAEATSREAVPQDPYDHSYNDNSYGVDK